MSLSIIIPTFAFCFLFGWIVGNVLINGNILDFSPCSKQYYQNPMSEVLSWAFRIVIITLLFTLSVILISILMFLFM